MRNSKPTFRDKVLALAGIFQAASLVDSLAWHGQCDPVSLEASLKSLLVPLDTPASTPLTLYGSDMRGLRSGLQSLEQTLVPPARHAHPRQKEVMRYAFALIYLERHIAGKPALRDELTKRLANAQRQYAFFRDINDPGMLKSFAGTYVDTVGSLKFRIQVRGSQKQLKTNGVPEQLRAALLTGIRAARLWHELGGRRWHLVFIRGKIARELRQIILEHHLTSYNPDNKQ